MNTPNVPPSVLVASASAIVLYIMFYGGVLTLHKNLIDSISSKWVLRLLVRFTTSAVSAAFVATVVFYVAVFLETSPETWSERLPPILVMFVVTLLIVSITGYYAMEYVAGLFAISFFMTIEASDVLEDMKDFLNCTAEDEDIGIYPKLIVCEDCNKFANILYSREDHSEAIISKEHADRVIGDAFAAKKLNDSEADALLAEVRKSKLPDSGTPESFAEHVASNGGEDLC